MQWVNQIPVLIKILLVLGIIILGLKLKIPLSISLLSGSVFAGIFFHMSAHNFLLAIGEGIFSFDTLTLVLIVSGILTLSTGMSVSGRLERIVVSFKKLGGESRITLVTFPALIGLLPMPGGAVFSAPMRLVAPGFGYLIILRKLSLSEMKYRDYSTHNFLDFFKESIPIIF